VDINSGIYEIKNIKNNKRYIGSSYQLKYRKRNHFNKLRNNNHPNIYLQKAYNKYGLENFEWRIIEYCNKEQFHEKETYWIDYYKCNNRKFGFNLRIVCENNSRVPGRGKIVKGSKNHRAKKYHIIDLETGQQYIGKCVAEFFREVNLKDPSVYFYFLKSTNSTIFHKKYTIPERLSKVKFYMFKNLITGEVIKSTYLKYLSKKYDINYSMLSKLHNGTSKGYKNWVKV